MSEQRERETSATAGRDDAAVLTFVERFAAQMVDAGMQRMPARVFSCLLASDSGVLTSAELGERLQVSPAAVSGAIRYLSQVGMVSREREPGSRRDRYRVHSDQWYEALTRRDSVLTRWEDVLREGVDSLGAESAAGRRLGETLAFTEFMQQELMGMMQRWREHLEELRTQEQEGGPAPETRQENGAARR
ncbi:MULTISPECIES: MarR family transcriptional regulator [unclassified Streptomyces]|uniref:GbsR/MarR family transcriptional regulator n=1 Tax=unclassified Streptomyces TaxID=2593676 RepID=UPI00037E7A67|nr:MULTISPECIES: MarR family transcriptional regulator [unclassified Streptomyces]MYT30836.1 MarR family transcriptional regulator [Streptomyces sp. SID8354]